MMTAGHWTKWGALLSMHFGQQCRPHTQQTSPGDKEWTDSRTSPPHSQGGTWDRSGGTPRFELHDSLYSNTSESVLGNSAEKSKCEIKKKKSVSNLLWNANWNVWQSMAKVCRNTTACQQSSTSSECHPGKKGWQESSNAIVMSSSSIIYWGSRTVQSTSLLLFWTIWF